MRMWLGCGGWKRGMPILGLLLAVGWAINWGQALSRQIPECAEQVSAMQQPGEPPMVDAPTAPLPGAPFTPPNPTPLAPGQADPAAPGIPFASPPALNPNEPVVRLHVRAPAQAQPDKEIEYHLTVENVSRADAHHVIVRDRLPLGSEESVRAEPKETRQTKHKSGSTDLIWELGTLKAAEKKEILLSLKPKGADEIQNSAYVQFEHGQTVKTRLAKPAISVRILSPQQSTLPDPIKFRLEVANTGAIVAEDVVLHDDLPEELIYGTSEPSAPSENLLEWKLGSLKPGEVRRVELSAHPTKAGVFTNKARVSAKGGLKQETSVRVTVGEALLKISTSGPLRRMAKRTIPYQISVRNEGTVPITNVQVTDEVPPPVELASVSPGGQSTRGIVRWALGTLAPGERRALHLAFRVPASGYCGNTVSVKADHNLADKARSRPTRVDPPGQMVVEIDRSFDALEVGQKALYTIHLVNATDKAVFRTTTLVTIPDTLRVLGKRGATPGTDDGVLLRFDPIQALDPGRTADYFIEVEAKKAGEAKLRVRLTDGRQEREPTETWDDVIDVRDGLKPTPAPPSSAYQVRGPLQNSRLDGR